MKKTTRREAYIISKNILRFLQRPAVTIRAAEILARDRELLRLKVKRVQ